MLYNFLTPETSLYRAAHMHRASSLAAFVSQPNQNAGNLCSTLVSKVDVGRRGGRAS
jgi:hypothetical protein